MRLSQAKRGEHALGAGTTPRFVLLLALFTASSASIMYDHIILGRFLGDPHHDVMGCMLASGFDPEGEFRTNAYAVLAHNEQAFEICTARYGPAWWAPILVIVLLMAASGALYWWLPAWKGRRSRVIDVDEIDDEGDLRSLLAELVSVAGLRRSPRFVVDPTAATRNAVVFGRTQRYTVCLHGGLVARRRVDTQGFRAVVLHELAHIHNGDVEITYATISLWRVFVVIMLLPYLARQIQLLFSGEFLRTDSIFWWVFWPGLVPDTTRAVLLAAFTVLLVYLSRADILRSREIYADLAAVAWGATPTGWHHGAHSGAVRSRIKNVLGSFAELWHTHPRWDRRNRSLTDPSALFGLQALPTFLTGVAASLVANQVESFLDFYTLKSAWAIRLSPWLAAGLITGIIGVALWRAVAHAVLAASPVPFGLRAGLWLGFGLAVGELLLARAAGNQWLPSRPAVMLVLVLLTVLITCWTAQCAEMWIKSQRERTARPVALLTLIGMWVVLAFWLSWWRDMGTLYAAGLLPPTGGSQVLFKAFSGSTVPYVDVLPTILVICLVVPAFGPLVVWAAMAMWFLPTLAWTASPGTDSLPSSHRAFPNGQHPASPEEELPSLRRVLLAAVLGGVSSWVAVAAVMAHMDSLPFDGMFAPIYWAWLLVALIAGPIGTAVVMGAGATRYRLPVALVAAGAAELLGVAGMFLLTAFDGCVGPFNMKTTVCHWYPNIAWLTIEQLSPNLLGIGVFATGVAALLAVGVANLIRKLPRLGVQLPSEMRQMANRHGHLTIRRICIVVICVLLLALAVTTQEVIERPMPSVPALSQTYSSQEYLAAASPPSPKIRKSQLYAWSKYGGNDLIVDLGRILNNISDNLIALSHVPDLDAALKNESNNAIFLRSTCAKMEKWTNRAAGYFFVPDPQQQLVWSKALVQMRKGSADCQAALTQRNATLLETSMSEMVAAKDLAVSVIKWLKVQLVGVK